MLAVACACSDTNAGATDANADQNISDAAPQTPIGSIASTLLDAEVQCNDTSCDIRVTEIEAPTRVYARARADRGEALVFDGLDRDTLYWASAANVSVLATGPYTDFSRPLRHRVWVASDTQIRQIDQSGQVWDEISELPQPSLTNRRRPTMGRPGRRNANHPDLDVAARCLDRN